MSKRPRECQLISAQNSKRKLSENQTLVSSDTTICLFDDVIFQLVIMHGNILNTCLPRCKKSFWTIWQDVLKRKMILLLNEAGLDKYNDIAYQKITHLRDLCVPRGLCFLERSIEIHCLKNGTFRLVPEIFMQYDIHDGYWVGRCAMCEEWPVWVGGNQAGWLQEVCGKCCTIVKNNPVVFKDYELYYKGNHSLNYNSLYDWMTRDKTADRDVVSFSNGAVLSLVINSGYVDPKTYRNIHVCNKRMWLTRHYWWTFRYYGH